ERGRSTECGSARRSHRRIASPARCAGTARGHARARSGGRVIRTNLATRPFYNERLVNLWLLLLGVIVLCATIFNVTRVRSDSGSNTEPASQATQNGTRMNEMRRTASQLRATLDAKQIEAVSADAREANTLIDRRTFSWTALFNRFETTLPDDARITSVRPVV